MQPIIFHIDCNSAYLSWTAIEQLKNGASIDLRAIPSIIGGDQNKRRGVVLAKSLSAKSYGVRTGEPVASALKKCPHLIMAPPNHELYHEHSVKMMKLLRTYTNDLEQVSVDETFLDFTPLSGKFPSPIAAAEKIKQQIREQLDFTVNIGIAPNKLLAKMASDFEKPDKIHTLFYDEIPLKLWSLPVEELFMVGRVSAKKLRGLGIRTIGELAAADPGILISHFKSHGKLMWEYANGIDASPVISEKREAKGIGNSTTLSEDAVTAEEAERVLFILAKSVSARLRKHKQIANTLTVEIKYHDFVSTSHQTRFLSPCSSTAVICETSRILFKELWNGEPIRLLGLRTTNLLPETAPIQLNLFDIYKMKSGEDR